MAGAILNAWPMQPAPITTSPRRSSTKRSSGVSVTTPHSVWIGPAWKPGKSRRTRRTSSCSSAMSSGRARRSAKKRVRSTVAKPIL